MKNFALILFMAITIASCSRNRYLTADYDRLANQHSVIAVLPYDIQLSGRKIVEMTDGEILEIREREGKQFQQSLYSEVLKRTGRRDKDINISVQDINKTNRLLKDAGVALTDIAEYSPKELGHILGVDAIISTRLMKEMFLSREESVLVDVATEVAKDVLKDSAPIGVLMYPNSKLSRSSEVDIYCTLVDTEAESAIWVYSTDVDMQWNMEPDEVIEQINTRISRKFPYRKK